jgi:murein DD-endopeptidase MepM/ murein hydrolase activator NlpD
VDRQSIRAVIILVSLISLPRWEADAEYPEIRSLSRDDLLFIQIQDDVETWYRTSMEKQPDAAPPVSLFVYRRKPNEDLFFLNARLNLPYDTLATLNGIESASAIQKMESILVCSQPGIFVRDPPRTELEQMMLGTRLQQGKVPQRIIIWRAGGKESFSFFSGSQFSDVERAYFLRILFRFPILTGSITSRYGPRPNPFSGHPEFHGGIDIGAPEGTEVHAAREGSVAEKGENSVLGRYIVLSHPGGYETVYGHLSAFNVTLGEEVTAGAVIGKVGKTGLATGSHLHFEVRNKGGTTDPWPLLRVRG